MTTTDPWFRPVDITLGPDGAIYIADWYDRQVTHYRNHEGQIDPGSGRIYRLRAKQAVASTRPRDGATATPDPAALATADLVQRLSDPNRWVRQTALRLIGDRKDRSMAPGLARLVMNQIGQTALEALWALNLVGGLDESNALRAVDHADRFVRLWTVRLLCDAGTVSPAVSAKLAARGAVEPDVEVRSQLACSAKRLPARDALPIIARLLAHSEDSRDIHIPLLLW